MSWYDEMVVARRSKSLTTGNVHEVLGSLALETPVNCHSELMEDSMGNIQPVQLGVEQNVSRIIHSYSFIRGCHTQPMTETC